MSKNANPGELRTPILLQNYTESKTKNGYMQPIWEDVFDGQPMLVKWVNIHGTEVWEAMANNLTDAATLTCRYTNRISPQSRLLKVVDEPQFNTLMAEGKTQEAEALYYNVISLDNVEERSAWLEVKVARKVPAK